MTSPRSFWYQSNHIKIHVDSADTEGRFSLLEIVQRPGSEPPMHTHEHEEETFLVLEGEMIVTCGGQERTLHAGESATVPRGVAHTFRVGTPILRSIAIFTPAGFEEFFRTMGQPSEESVRPTFAQIGEVAARYGSRLVV